MREMRFLNHKCFHSYNHELSLKEVLLLEKYIEDLTFHLGSLNEFALRVKEKHPRLGVLDLSQIVLYRISEFSDCIIIDTLSGCHLLQGFRILVLMLRVRLRLM